MRRLFVRRTNFDSVLLPSERSESVRLRVGSVFMVWLLVAPALTHAQVPRHVVSQMGVFDDEAMTRSTGTMDDTDKVLYVGIRYNAGTGFSSLYGLEFSITGLDDLDYSFDILDDPAVVTGDVAAPVNAEGVGGINITWVDCIEGDRVFARLTLHATNPVPRDRTFRIERRFPPSNPNLGWIRVLTCECDPICVQSADSLDYILNPTVTVQPVTWDVIKRLYRGTQP